MINTIKIINKLIQGTKDNKFKWSYLPINNKLSSVCFQLVYGDLNYNSSFVLKINNGYFALCDTVDSDIYLIIIPSLDSKDIQCINEGESGFLEYQQELLRLQNLVKKQFPNVEDFLEEFMDD